MSGGSFNVLAGVVVLGLCGVPSLSLGAVPFLRGDVDSSGELTLLDVMQVLRGLFDSRGGTLACLDAADADDSGSLEVTDALVLLNALFANGPFPGRHFPTAAMTRRRTLSAA